MVLGQKSGCLVNEIVCLPEDHDTISNNSKSPLSITPGYLTTFFDSSSTHIDVVQKDTCGHLNVHTNMNRYIHTNTNKKIKVFFHKLSNI